ncbi:MAG: estB1 [Armatimonadetes bacterium]|nr:estB1 [Armatimonadota bacterium]
MTSGRTFLLGASALGLTAGTTDAWKDTVAFLEAQQAEGVFPGAALLVTRSGKSVFERYQGTYCSLTRRDAPLTAAVRHPLYSFSKLVSATVVLMAVQDGLVKLDEPMVSYVPEFTGGGKDASTLRHLLTHSAGIPSAPVGGASTEPEWKQAVAAVCAAKTEWEPGSRTAYHGLTGLFVAAEAVRRKNGGKTWETLRRERLFTPLGAASLTFALPPEEDLVALTPQPKELPKTVREAFPYAGHPAGGCFGTATDAMKVLQLHLNGGTWGQQRLLGEPLLREMHRVQYLQQIEQARADSKPPVHEPWELGPLLRGPGPKSGGHDWFGFREGHTTSSRRPSRRSDLPGIRGAPATGGHSESSARHPCRG